MIRRTTTAAAPRKTKPKGPHPHNALSAAFLRSAPPGKHIDGNGLYLYVQPSGARSWVQRLVIRGRSRELGLGSARLVPLAEAREKALANRKLAREGGDPLAERHRLAGMPTFAEAAAAVIEQKRPGWRGPRQATVWRRSLETYAFPRIGDRPVSEVDSADILRILTPIWHVRMQTARTVRRRIGSVLEWAIAMNYRNDNPADRVLPALGPQNEVVRHRQALPHREVAAAIATMNASRTKPAVKLAFEFLVLTAARSGEIRGAVWSEMDTEARVWTIPAERMKMKRGHRVPLCGRAIEILDAARVLSASPLVFARPDGKPLDEKRMLRVLQWHRVAAVPHGFRSSFRDWAAEETDHPREVIEAALAHVVRNPVEAAYARSDLFERRRRLMEDWSNYIAETSPEQPPAAEPAEQGVAGITAP